MKYFVSFFSLLILVACSTSETDVSKNDSNDSADQELNEAVESAKSYLFESTDEGVTEYLRLSTNAEGNSEWTYFTERNSKEIELGRKREAGFELLYFKNKPKNFYWVYEEECGFTLADEVNKSSQWYGQKEPRCSEDHFTLNGTKESFSSQ